MITPKRPVFQELPNVSILLTHAIYDYAVSFVAGGVVRFYFLHKWHISIPFGPISRGTDANEVFVYVHTKNVFASGSLVQSGFSCKARTSLDSSPVRCARVTSACGPLSHGRSPWPIYGLPYWFPPFILQRSKECQERNGIMKGARAAGAGAHPSRHRGQGACLQKTGAEQTARHRTYHTPYSGRLYAENIFV